MAAVNLFQVNVYKINGVEQNLTTPPQPAFSPTAINAVHVVQDADIAFSNQVNCYSIIETRDKNRYWVHETVAEIVNIVNA